MANEFHVVRADFQFEAGFSQPEFSFLERPAKLVDCLFKALEPHGARLSDIRIERGVGTAADFHLLCYLFNFWVTLRVRVDKIEIVGSEMPQEYVQRYGAAILAALEGVRSIHQDLSYRAYALVVGMHGSLEGNSPKEYLSKFVANIPNGLGPVVGNGAVMYFGAAGERLLCSLTVDMSGVVTDALFVRTHILWDAKKVKADALPKLANDFVREAVDQIGLNLPA